jgi:DNA repair protein SbcD/Mre11
VHVFPLGRPSEVIHDRDGAPLARLIGLSRQADDGVRPDDFGADPRAICSIVVAHGDAEAAALGSRGIDYWALGGRHDRSTLFNSPHAAHYPGSPQGRRPEEAGPHGCSLVHVDEQCQARISPVATDVMRWLSERIVVDDATTRARLEDLLRERLHAMAGSVPKMDLLVSWRVAGSGPLLAELRRGGLAAELLGWLRAEFGMGRPAIWSVSLEVEPQAGLPAEWYEQETIRGDFLRALAQLETDPAEPLALESYLSEAHLAGTLASAAAPERVARQKVLRQAALLGVDLLSGE